MLVNRKQYRDGTYYPEFWTHSKGELDIMIHETYGKQIQEQEQEIEELKDENKWYAEVTNSLTQENLALKEQVATLIRILGAKA
jgi:GH24 family phage-related lysozyme (muramidase)